MFDNDHIQRFLFDDTNIRGELIHLEKVIQKVYGKHNYPLPVKQALTECLLCGLLMSSTLKFEGQLTIQFQSKSAISLLLVKCNHLFQTRALAQFDDKASDAELANALDNGSLVVTIESDKNVKPYQSIVPIRGSICESFEFYFEQSMQLPTRFFLSATKTKAAGIMLQQMPSEPDQQQQLQQDWQHLSALTDTVTDEELLTLTNEDMLYRLFHQDKCRLFPAHSVQFHCPCSKAKMLESIKLFGEKEAMDILNTHKCIEVKCEFCLENYAFEKNDISYLFQSQ